MPQQRARLQVMDFCESLLLGPVQCLTLSRKSFCDRLYWSPADCLRRVLTYFGFIFDAIVFSLTFLIFIFFVILEVVLCENRERNAAVRKMVQNILRDRDVNSIIIMYIQRVKITHILDSMYKVVRPSYCAYEV